MNVLRCTNGLGFQYDIFGQKTFFLLSAFCFNPTISANFRLHRHRSHSLLIESKRSTDLGRQRWKDGEGWEGRLRKEGDKGERGGRELERGKERKNERDDDREEVGVTLML